MAALPSLVCRAPSRRWAKARCSSSVNGWSWNTRMACSSMPRRISASVSGSSTRRRSTGHTSATKCLCSRSKRSAITASGSRIYGYTALDLALKQETVGVIDVLEPHRARDQLAQLVLAVHEEVNEHRDVRALVPGAERRARQHALLQEELRVQAQARAGRRDAHHHRRPAAVRGQHGLLDRALGA